MSSKEPSDESLTREELRLKEDRERKKYWKRWGPYVAERQWGTGACPPGASCDWGRLNGARWETDVG